MTASSSDGYEIALFLLQKAACIPSAIGSLMIISQVSRSKFNRRRTQQRLLLAISLIDFQTSILWIFTNFFVPEDSGMLFASGNQSTCDAQGFIVQFSTAGILYMCALQLQYVLVIKYGWKEYEISNIEKYFHAVSIVFGLGTATAALVLEQYNPADWDCWIAGSPQDCTSSNEVKGGQSDLIETNCTRGDNADIYRWAFFFGPLWGSIAFCIYAMILVYQTIKKTQVASQKYRFRVGMLSNRLVRGTRNDQNNNNDSNGNSSGSNESKLKKVLPKRFQKKDTTTRNSTASTAATDRVRHQSIRYSSAFFIVWTFPTISRILQLIPGVVIPPFLKVLSGTTIGLQGFFNALIYFRPRYNKCVKYNVWYKKVWALVASTLFFWCYHDDYTKNDLDYVGNASTNNNGETYRVRSSLISNDLDHPHEGGEVVASISNNPPQQEQEQQDEFVDNEVIMDEEKQEEAAETDDGEWYSCREALESSDTLRHPEIMAQHEM